MSKKFKKKIETLCGLVGLDWEARQERAGQILCSTSWKQQLCNDLQGLSFRDLELYLQDVVSERQKKEEGVERKLATHGDDNEKPVRRGSTKSPPNLQVRPRTLSEILAQVHAPRVEFGGFTPEEREKLKLWTKKESVDILPDTLNDDGNGGG